MDFLQRTPFFRLLLPFVVGIVLYQFVELPLWGLVAASVLSLLLVILSFAVRVPKYQFKFRWLFGCGIFLFMASLAYVLSVEHEKEKVFDHLNRKGIYQVELVSAPVAKARSYMCKAEILSYYESGWKPARGQAILYFQKDATASELLFGDQLLVEARFAPPEKPLNPDGFDYAAYLKRQGIGATCYIASDSWKPVGKAASFSIRREADKCRKFLLDVYRKFNIAGDEFAVLAALTLGYTDDLQPDLRASYSATGAMHILSVSGMHVGVVYVVMAFLLGFLNKSRRQKVFKGLFIMLFLWAYAFLTGMSAAVIRATLMFSILAFGSCFERKSQIYNTIFLSAFVMLLINPDFLFDIGFQLSYSAVLSIVFFQPVINKLYTPGNKPGRLVWDIFSVSLAAQLGTAPFTLYYFQQFPNYFLITNFIAIPLSSLVIYLAIGLLVVSSVPYVSIAVGFVLKWALWLLNFLIVWIQHLPYSLSHISIDHRQTFLIFIAIFCFSGCYYSRKFKPLLVGLLSLLVASLFSFQANWQTQTSKRLIVYAGQKHTHVSMINRSRNQVYTTDSVEAEKLGRTFWQNQKLDEPLYLPKSGCMADGFVSFGGKRIMILEPEYFRGKTTSNPIDLDYLIIGEGQKPKIDQVLDCVHPREIIVDRNISHWYTESIRKACQTRGICFYAISEQGAFVLNVKD